MIKIFLLITALIAFSAYAQDTIPQKVLQVAQNCNGFLTAAITKDNYKLFNLDKFEDVDKITAGNGYIMHIITEDQLERVNSTTRVFELLKPSNLWYFEAIVGGKVKFMFIVDFFEGSWQIVSAGYANLALQVNEIKQYYCKHNTLEKPILGVCYSAKRYVFSIPSYGEKNLTLIPEGSVSRNLHSTLGTVQNTTSLLLK